LALAPSAQAEVPDVETTVESTIKADPGVSGLVALLLELGFDVEFVEFDANVETEITLEPEVAPKKGPKA
jgi:hypothetical protein